LKKVGGKKGLVVGGKIHLHTTTTNKKDHLPPTLTNQNISKT